ADALHRRFPPDTEAAHGVWHILRTGQAEMVSEITSSLLQERFQDGEQLHVLQEQGLKSYMGVPLRARGRTLGVMTFLATASGRHYDAADLALAEDLAHRAGIAVENAALYASLREADRHKDEFLAMLAHELRNPLAPIRNSLQILRMPQADTATVTQAKNMMDRQLQHLVRLVDDLLDVS